MQISAQVSLLAAMMVPALPLAAQQQAQTSRVGYIYPAGGQAGSTVEVIMGGKGFFNVRNVSVSGEGVTGEYIEQVSNYKNRLQEQIKILRAEKTGKPTDKLEENRRFGPLPDHPMFSRLEDLSPEEFKEVADKFGKMERVQRNRELDQLAVVRITISPDAEPGMREIRLVTGTGITNPVRFMINSLPELQEYEPNDRQPPADHSAEIPFVMNGQVMPGDVDWLSFTALKGQKLAIRVQARALVPYLADAVPGWFQAVIALTNEAGKEIAYADDDHFSPDPAIWFEVPESGIYHLSIRDSIYRGREDFVYRVTVDETPFAPPAFPLLGREQGFPEILETEAAGNRDGLTYPFTINGRIDHPGDVDLFPISARAGERILVSVYARRLLSPLDSLVRVLDAEGNVLAWNDDLPNTGRLTDRTGLLTHNADSELVFEAPTDGTYRIQLSDTQSQGGDGYAYRLEVSVPEPDFVLYASPSGIGVPAGGAGVVTLHLKRLHGFDGPVTVRLENAPKGISLSGNTIPAGCDTLPVVIRTGFLPLGQPVQLQLSGEAAIGQRRVRHPAIPADDCTQAFITHHLVEAGSLVVASVSRPGKLPAWKPAEAGSVELQAGQSARIEFNTREADDRLADIHYELKDPPDGIELQAEPFEGGVRLSFTGTQDLRPGLAGNLIVAMHTELPAAGNNGKKGPRRISIGVLPAIPYTTR